MSNTEIIFEQAKIIDQLAEINRKYSSLIRNTLSLLSQHQSVAAEEERLKEIEGGEE